MHVACANGRARELSFGDIRRVVLFLLLSLGTAAQARVTTDLDAGWISHEPEIAYVWNSTNPRVEGWPSPGEAVTWRAHVRNWSTTARSVQVRRLLDGDVVLEQTFKRRSVRK